MKLIKDKMTFFVVLFAVIVTSFSMVFLVTHRNVEKINTTDSRTVKVYYKNIATGLLEPEEKKLNSTKKEDIILETLDYLEKPPTKEQLTKVTSENIEFNNVYLDKSNITVDISNEFYDLKDGDRLMFTSSVFSTFTSLDFIEKVKITVEGKEILKSNGKELGFMSKYNIVTDNQIMPEPLNYEKVKLYFVDTSMKKLEAEERIIEVNPNQPIENYVIQQLLEGPQRSTSVALFSSDSKISFLRTVDGVCYVDLGKDMLQKLSLGTINETLAIYSIVNSLCALESVDKVKFLSDGKKIEDYKGTLDLSNAFVSKTI